MLGRDMPPMAVTGCRDAAMLGEELGLWPEGAAVVLGGIAATEETRH